jgi:predicted RNase H-like HicB family nuclease
MKANQTNSRPLEYYLDLNYPIELIHDSGDWVASVPDLPGCISYGETVSSAVENVQKTKALWIKGQFEHDHSIPEPTVEADFSGKFVLRVPKVLHRSLVYEARKQGVSLNHYASHLLSQRNPINEFHQIAKSILDSVCPPARNSHWFYGSHAPGGMVVAGNLTGNVEFLAVMRKPPTECKFTTRALTLMNAKFLSE